MNSLCSTCSHRRGNICLKATKSPGTIAHLTTCPAGLWGEVEPQARLKVLWLMGDYAKGGTSRYTCDLFNILSPLPIDFKVLYFSEQSLDTYTASRTPCSVELYSYSRFLEYADWADRISAIGMHSQVLSVDKVLDVAKPKLFSQLHGSCQYTKDLYQFNLKFTKTFMACTPKAASILPPSISCFTPPMPIDFSRCCRQQEKASRPFSPEDKIVVVACRQSGDKNLLGIAQAVAECPPNYKLLCVGDGPYAVELHPQMKALLGDRVTFRPWTREPSEYLDVADCFICMSPNEGGPLTVIEAMAHGVPVVSTDVGVVFDYKLQLSGKLDQQIAFAYKSYRDIIRACEFSDDVSRLAILDMLKLKHSPHLIRQVWWDFLSRHKSPSSL